jgi:hypothetical protein
MLIRKIVFDMGLTKIDITRYTKIFLYYSGIVLFWSDL